MTLVIAATCQDGVVVCADKRRTLKKATHATYIDDLYKLYRFKNVNVLAYNHGINRIRGKDWESYLSKFESTQVEPDIGLNELVEKFKIFMSGPVLQELATNTFDDATGFVFLAAPPGSVPLVREIFWKKHVSLEDKLHRGLIRTGNGARYLDQYLMDHPEVNTVEHWEAISTDDGVEMLRNLFNEACKRRREQSGEEFSDTFDTGTMKSQ